MTDIDAIEARAAAATPGPWRRDVYDDTYLAADLAPWRDGDYCKLFWDSEGDGLSWPNPADLDFIAHARSDISALLARIRALEAREAALREGLRANHERLEKEHGHSSAWPDDTWLSCAEAHAAMRTARALLSDAPVVEETPQ